MSPARAALCSAILGPGPAALRVAAQLFKQAVEQQSGSVGQLEQWTVQMALTLLQAATSTLVLAARAPGSAHSRAILATLCSPGRLRDLLEAGAAALHCVDHATGAAVAVACGMHARSGALLGCLWGSSARCILPWLLCILPPVAS